MVLPVLHAYPHEVPIREGRNSPDAEFNFGTGWPPVGTRPDTSRHNTVDAQESLAYMQMCHSIVRSRSYDKHGFSQSLTPSLARLII